MMGHTRALCIREHQVTLRNSAKQLLEDKIKEWGVGHKFRPLSNLIETPHDGIISFQGMKNHTSDSIKSFEGYDVAWFEEANSATKRSIDLLYPTIRKDDSECWFSWNPNQPNDAIERFAKYVGNDGVTIDVTYKDNPWFPETMRNDMERDRVRDPDRYAHIWLGGFDKKTNARVFSNVRLGELHELEGIPRDNRLYGADFGFARDPTVLLEGAVKGRTLYITGEAYKIGLEIDHTPAYWKEKVPGCDQFRIRADGARPETISYLRRHGFERIMAAVKGPGSVKEGVEFLKSFDIVIHPRCEHAWDEFSTYCYEIDKNNGDVLPKLPDLQNHTIDAGRYMIEALRRGAKGVF